MNRRADSAGYAVVYPNGTGWLRYFNLTWNAGGCCGEALAHKVNDVEFIRDLIGRLETALPIDSARIYVTGFSDGGRLAYRIGCDLSPLVAAIATVSAGMPDTTCRPAQPISVAIFHGTADRFIPYGTRAPRRRFFRRPGRPASVPDIFRFFARADGCAGPATQAQHGSIVEQRFARCAEGSEVRLYTIEGGDHAWPGGRRGFVLEPEPTRELDASTVMLQFFASHARWPP